MAAVECYVRQHVFSASVEQNERSQSLAWVSTPQRDNLFCFLFSGTVIVGVRRPSLRRTELTMQIVNGMRKARGRTAIVYLKVFQL